MRNSIAHIMLISIRRSCQGPNICVGLNFIALSLSHDESRLYFIDVIIMKHNFQNTSTWNGTDRKSVYLYLQSYSTADRICPTTPFAEVLNNSMKTCFIDIWSVWRDLITQFVFRYSTMYWCLFQQQISVMDLIRSLAVYIYSNVQNEN